MKWFLIGLLCLLCSSTWARADAAGDLYIQGVNDMILKKYDAAGKAFDQIIKDYPSSSNIDEVRMRAGYAYLYGEKFPEAVDRLSKEAAPTAKPEFRSMALYFTAIAQFSQGQKYTDPKSLDKNQAQTAFTQAVATFSTLIDVISKTPTPDNQAYLEQAFYYRALAQYELENYPASEKDLLVLLQSPQFSASLSRPDYLLRLGSIYAVETNQAVTAKQSTDAIKALANKALSTFDQVSKDPNALIQANEANLSEAEILLLLAHIDATNDGYEKTLDALHLVRRKDDLIPLQEKNLKDLQAKSQQQLQDSLASLSNANSLLTQREEGRLNDLKTGPDPIIEALVLMAQCYNYMQPPEPDEARIILHRLIAHAQLSPDQQQEVDFQLLFSYVLGGETAQAEKLLDEYLTKHPGDPQADEISYQIAAALMNRQDYAGALAQVNRSLADFPQGRVPADAVVLKAQALTRLGRIAESEQTAEEFLKANPNSPQAVSLRLSGAQNEMSTGNVTAALVDYQKVRDDPSASPAVQASADAGYIQALQTLQRYDEVITEAKAFAAKYSTSKALPGVLVLAGMAMDQKHDPGAIAALQDVIQKYPNNATAPYALYAIINIDQRANNIPAMTQAAAELRTNYPTAYPLLALAADAVSTVLLKDNKFDDAIALYQPLLRAPKPDIVASARNKIGAIWLAAVKALGHYQSMTLAMRVDAEKRLSAAEQEYVGTLKAYPGQLDAVGDAFEGLVTAIKQRRSWDQLKDGDLENALDKLLSDSTNPGMQTEQGSKTRPSLSSDLASPDMQAHLELARAGLVFIMKDGDKQYAAALDRYKKVMTDHPDLRLTRQETNQFGELLLAAQDYPTALKIYSDLLANASPANQAAQSDANYGLGATYLGQGDAVKAKAYFSKVGAWHPHILDADYGIALADEQSNDPADNAQAQQLYAQLMQQGNIVLQAKAMLGFGRLLEKAGHALKPTASGPNEYAVHYYQEPDLISGPATPEQSAEGLFDAGQVYEKAGDKANAKKQYDTLLKTYATTAPDWAAKAKEAEGQ